MPLELSLMEYDDIPAFAAVDAVAMAEYGMAQAVFANDTSGKTRQQLVVDWTRKGFVNDDKQVWLKVTDTDCGNEMVAAAFWRFQFEEPASSKGGSVESLLSEAEKQQKSEGGPRSVIEEMGRLAAEFKQEFVGTKPHAWLQILVTHPKHQRRGAGSMLVKWGCDKADERHIMCVLNSSPAGLAIYLKYGFQVVKEVPLDLRPYGVDEVEIRRSMFRPAKVRTT